MWWILYPIALVGVGTSLAALAGYAYQYRSGPGVHWFVGSLLSSATWTGLTVVGLLLGGPLAGVGTTVFGDMGTARIWLDLFSTVAGLLSLVTWVMFVIHYTGRTDLFTRPFRAGLLVVFATLSVLVLTTLEHGLFLDFGTDVSTVGGLLLVDPVAGPLFGVVVATGMAVLALGVWLLLGLFWTNDRLFSRHAVLMLVGVLAPVGFALPRLVVGFQLPLIPIGFAITCVCFAYALFAEDFLALTPAVSYVGTRDAISDLDTGVVLTGANGRALKANEAARDLLDVEEIVGRSTAELFDSAGVDADQLPADVSHDGRYLALSEAPITDDFDRRIGTTITVRDVTQRKLRQQRLQVLNRIVRHNIRNDLGVVEGYASMLRNDPDAAVDEVASRIERKAGEVVDLSENARTIERLFAAPSQIGRISLRSRLDDLAARLDSEYDGLTVEVTVSEDGHVVTDLLAFEEALWALAENAAEYADPDDPRIELAADSSAREAEIRIEDNGPGIPDVELDGIRSGAETPLEHGSGLGLWVAHWGARRLDGDLAFAVDDTGTTVTVTVPCLEIKEGIDPERDPIPDVETPLLAEGSPSGTPLSRPTTSLVDRVGDPDGAD